MPEYNFNLDEINGEIEEIEKMCDRDKWMKPTEAIAKGFLDSIIEPKKK